MNGLTPWPGLATLRQEMDRLFDRVLEPRWVEAPTLGEWLPRLDVSESNDAVIVKTEVPGVDPKDIELSLQDRDLTIKGEKKHEKEERDERYHRVECSWGAFARSVRLPAAVDGSKVTATFKNGLLTITLPKAAMAKGTTIPIKAA